MVALRGSTNSVNYLPHTCGNHGNHGNRGPPPGIEMPHNMQSTIRVQHPMPHLNHAVNLQPVNNISYHQYMQPRNNSNCIKHEQPAPPRNHIPNCALPSPSHHHYTLVPQTRGECYHTGGGAGAAYMTGGSGGAPQSAQPAMRTASAPQPATSQSPQDMQNNSMGGHNFVSQSQQQRQYTNFSGFRTPQHGSRPSSHPRQQNFLPGGNAASPSVMYHQSLMFPTTHMGATHMPQTYQQPRAAQQYYQYIHPYNYNYNNPQNHTTPYYGYGSQQMPAPTMPPNNNPTRTNPSPHVAPPAAAPTPPTTNIPPHISNIQPTQNNIRPLLGRHCNKRHRIAIINPDTNQDVLVEMYSNDNVSAEGMENHSERNHIIEDFARRVNEAASESKSDVKSYPSPALKTATNHYPNQQNASPNAILPTVDIVKSDILTINESVSLGPDVAVAVESEDTPVVSALSGSPVIVPKVPVNKKPVKNEQPSVVIDNNKNVPPVKPQKPSLCTPAVPQSDELEKEEEEEAILVEAPYTSLPTSPLPQRIREPRERRKSLSPVSMEKTRSQFAANGPAQTPPMSPPLQHSSAANSNDSLYEIINELDREKSNTIQHPVLQYKYVHGYSESPTASMDHSASAEAVETKAMTNDMPERARSYRPQQVCAAQKILDQSLICNKQNTFEARNNDYYLKTIDTDSDIPDVVESTEQFVNHVDIKSEVDVITPSEEIPPTVNEPAPKYEEEVVLPEEDETSSISEPIEEKIIENSVKPAVPPVPTVVMPKHRYAEGHWSPLNPRGKKRYDLFLLMQIKDDALSNNKPNIPRLEQLKVVRTTHVTDYLSLHNLAASRPTSDALFPNFLKPSQNSSKNMLRVDPKKDMRGSLLGMKNSQMSSSSSMKQNVIHVSLSNREEVKLNETENAWKPTRFKKTNLSDEAKDEAKTQEVYKKFRGILNKLTPQKFDQLMERVKLLEIDTQKRLEGVIDLVFEKAIDEPNFSKAYAAMCNKLSKLKVPAENSPDQVVNFRVLIINKCQTQFVTKKVDETVEKLEKDMNDCTDPTKKKELFLLLQEENRRIRMRSVGNVRFIGELFKLKMLTPKIMLYCMDYLIDKLEEEKLECLCKLLTTIGEQIEMEIKDKLDEIFKRMQHIVDQKSNKISSRVRFMLQDVIELRRRHWVTKSVVDLQPKMMDQIQKEAEQQQRQTELLNSIGGFRGRDDGGRGKRDSRRSNQNALFESSNNWKTSRINYPVDTSKLKAVSHKTLENIKLAPMKTHWGSGSGMKAPATTSFLTFPSATVSVNKFSVLDTSTNDTPSVRATSSGSRSLGVPLPEPVAPPPVQTPAPAPTPAAASDSPPEPLSDQKVALVKNLVDQALVSPDKDDLTEEIKLCFETKYHASVVTNILNVALEKNAKDVDLIAKSLLHLVQSKTISANNFLNGLTDVFEIAPDLYIDIPMLYTSISKIIVPQIECKHVTLAQILRISDSIVSGKQGHLLLRCILKGLKESMGSPYVKTKWEESGLQFKDWMNSDQVEKFLADNDFQFIEGDGKLVEEVTKVVTPGQAQKKLFQLMLADENCECIRGWVQANVGKSANEDWFMKSLIQAICEYALFGDEPRGMPHFNQDRMNKYSELINEFGDSKESREASCLFGIQQLIHHLEHPQGITLEIFQYLHEQYIITVEGFTAWEMSEKEPEGKGVMMKALTSFFTSIKEVDNEDSLSED